MITANQSLWRIFVPLFLVICFFWLLVKYSSIQASIGNENNELIHLNEAIANANSNKPGQSVPDPGAHLIHQLLMDAEVVWQEAKTKRVAAIKDIGGEFSKDPWQANHAHNAWTIFWDFFTPAWHCPRPIERIGRIGDGGKWVCGFTHIAKRPQCVVYSYGISSEITFEQEILEKSACIIRMYDHTINITKGAPAQLVAKYPERTQLNKLGLGAQDKHQLRTLRSEMERNGDQFIDILKIDVEGAEWSVMEAMLEDFPGTLPFGQLQIELHLKSLKGDVLDYFSKWFGQLEDAGLRAFWSEPNQIPTIHKKTSRIDFIEYSFFNCKIDVDYFV